MQFLLCCLLILSVTAGLTTQRRTLVLIQNRTLGTVSALAALADPNHTRAITYGRGMYSAGNAAELDLEALTFYAETFGPDVDLRAVPFNPTLFGVGGWTNGKVAAFQYIIGVNSTGPSPVYDYVLDFDSDNLGRGQTGNWRNLAVGVLVLALTNLTTPVGAILPNDVLGFADYNLVRLTANNWNLNINREIIRVATPYISKSFPTQFTGLQANLSPLRVIDDCGRAGYGAITSTFAGPDYQAFPVLRQYNIFTAFW